MPRVLEVSVSCKLTSTVYFWAGVFKKDPSFLTFLHRPLCGCCPLWYKNRPSIHLSSTGALEFPNWKLQSAFLYSKSNCTRMEWSHHQLICISVHSLLETTQFRRDDLWYFGHVIFQLAYYTSIKDLYAASCFAAAHEWLLNIWLAGTFLSFLMN